jgi:hypothetical protein
MKTKPHLLKSLVRMRVAFGCFMFILFFVCLFQKVSAQSPNRFQNDPYFPAKGRFNAGFITTYRGSSVPAPVAIGEVTYGFSNKFSMGVVGGTTGTLSVVGIRLAGNFYQKNNFRLLGHLSIIYYPERKGTYLFDQSHVDVMPWMLSMGFLDAEWRLRNGVRLSAGMGLLETHCVDGMMNLLFNSKGEADEVFQVFNTLRTSVAIPLSRRFTLQPEAIMVMRGAQIVSSDTEKVGPLYLYLHFVYTF